MIKSMKSQQEGRDHNWKGPKLSDSSATRFQRTIIAMESQQEEHKRNFQGPQKSSNCISRHQKPIILCISVYMLLCIRMMIIHTQQSSVLTHSDRTLEVQRRSKGTPPLPKKDNLALLICNEKYCNAVANLIVSLRLDGGYMDDIAVIIDESVNYTIDSLRADIVQEGGTRGQNETASMVNIKLWSAEGLFDSLELDRNSTYLRESPPFPSCQAESNKNYTPIKHRGYFLKSLMFHPIVTNWKRVLYMDACMTIHSPHIHEIFSLPEGEGHILVSSDPWYWGQRGIGAKLLQQCPENNATQLVGNIVGNYDLKQVRYFASGLIVYDTSIVREYGSSPAATVIDILSLYHKLGKLFKGDQEILSIYWVYIRKEFRMLPLAMFENNRIPYEFVKRVPHDPHIVTAGHKTREVCKQRPTNRLST